MTGKGIWTDVRLRAAWQARDWADIFREYRRAAGVSQMGLGSLIGMPQSHVSLIENGKRRVTSAQLVARITEGLAVPAELTGLPEPNESDASVWTPDPELRDRIARAHTTGRTDVRTADWIARVLTEHRRAEDQIGGKNLWLVVRSQLDTVTRLLPGTSGTTADRLMVLSAEHAHWLSWVAHSEGKYGAALTWLDTAYGWALDAGSAEMISWIARVRSFYALDNGDPVRALRIAEIARQAPGPLSPASASVAAHQAAMAAAAVGERDRSRRLADTAYELAQTVPDVNDRPGWLYWLDPVRAILNRADAAYATRDWPTAAAGFRETLDALQGYPRDHAYYAARLADAQARI